MKRKSVLMLLSVLTLSSVLTACDKPIKIGPITLGGKKEEATESGDYTTVEYQYGDTQLGTVLGTVECENILLANGIDPASCVSYLFDDGTGTMLSELTFNEAGVFSKKVLYQDSEGVHEIPFVINVIDINGTGTEQTGQPEQNTSGFLGYDIVYPTCDVVDTAAGTPIVAGTTVQLPEGVYLNGSVKEIDSTGSVFADSTSVDYQQPVTVYSGVALASENPDLKFDKDGQFILYTYASTTTLKDATDLKDRCYIFMPADDVSETLDYESDMRTYGDAGVEYDAGLAGAILSYYKDQLTQYTSGIQITANVAGDTSTQEQTQEPVVDDGFSEEEITEVSDEVEDAIVEEIEQLPTDIVDEDISDKLTHEIEPPKYRERYPDVYEWRKSDMDFSRWNYTLTDSTQINQVIIRPDGTQWPKSKESEDSETINVPQGNTTDTGNSTTSNNNNNSNNNESEVKNGKITVTAAYTQFNVSNYPSMSLEIDPSSTANDVIVKNAVEKYHVSVISKGELASYTKANMFTNSKRVPSDSSKYSIEEGTILERDGYEIKRYNIKFIDAETGYQETRLYMVTITPEKAPSDILAIHAEDVCGEFDENPLNIAKNCIEVVNN